MKISEINVNDRLGMRRMIRFIKEHVEEVQCLSMMPMARELRRTISKAGYCGTCYEESLVVFKGRSSLRSSMSYSFEASGC